MRYIKFTGDAGFRGTSFEEYDTYNDNTPDIHLTLKAMDIAGTNASSYEYLAGDISEEELIDDFYENISYSWEEITEEEYREALGL